MRVPCTNGCLSLTSSNGHFQIWACHSKESWKHETIEARLCRLNVNKRGNFSGTTQPSRLLNAALLSVDWHALNYIMQLEPLSIRLNILITSHSLIK